MIVGGVAHGMQRPTVREGGGEFQGRLDTGAARGFQHTAGGARDRTLRISGQAFVEHQQKKEFGIGGALALVENGIGERVLQRAADLLEAADLAIVHERPAAGDEGMAVHPAGGSTGRGAHMSEEQAGIDLPAEAFQIGIGPGRQDVAIETGLRPVAIPGEAEAVAIGRRLGLLGAVTLGDQRVAGRGNDVFEEDRFTEIGRPPAHRIPPSVRRGP